MDMPVAGKFGEKLHPAADITRYALYGMIAVITLFGALFVWAAFAPLSGAVIATGYVKVDTNHKTVQHLEGGIVKAILVKEGDIVRAGQPLITIVDEKVAASVDLIQGQWRDSLAKAARLRAQRDDADHIEFPAALTQHADDPEIAEVMKSETGYFEAKRDALNNQIGLLRKQIDEAKAEVSARTEQFAAERKASELLEEEIAANEKLVAENNVAKVQLLALRRQLEDYNSRMSEDTANMATTRQKITDMELKIVSLKNDYLESAANELTSAQSDVYDQEERLRPSLDAMNRQTVTAPITGTVINMRVFTVGGVIRPGDAILDIVPADNPLVIEAKIQVDSIDDVHLGQAADIRLTAYKTRTTPLIAGKVIYLAADRTVDDRTGESYYLARIEAYKESLVAAGDIEMYPGMPAEVFIRTGTRTALDYLLSPIENTLRRSFRES